MEETPSSFWLAESSDNVKHDNFCAARATKRQRLKSRNDYDAYGAVLVNSGDAKMDLCSRNVDCYGGCFNDENKNSMIDC